MSWLQEHYQWVFSGVGVAIVVSIVGLLGHRATKSINQKAGRNGTNIYAEGNVSVDRRQKDRPE